MAEGSVRRRLGRLGMAALLAAIALGASGCGGDGASGGTAAGGDAPGFPVEIEHAHGVTRIEAPPERVVTVGLTDHDALIALGVVPVGVTDWYGERENALWPWAREALGGAEPPEVVGDARELNLERIAALRPDLILGLYAAVDAEQYGRLSRIAPTVVQPADHPDDYGIPWQELTLTAGRAVGREERARELVAEVEARIARARAEHPGLDGATGLIATVYQGIYVYGPDVANSRMLRSLGIRVPDEVDRLIERGADPTGTQLSLERANLLDVDVLVWLDATRGEGPLANPLYRRLDVHREGREVLLDSGGRLGGASFVSVLSIPYLLDELVPMLAAAADGDPATPVPAE